VEINLSATLRAYVMAIYHLQEQAEWVQTGTIAVQLKVSNAAVTQMMGRLAQSHLVRHRPYRGVRLTEKGRRVAVEMVRHHRLMETFLFEVIGMPWDLVHQEAVVLQAHITPEFERRIDALLGYPRFDPHGSPIPTADGVIPPVNHRSLEEVAQEGDRFVISRVSDRDPQLLRYLDQLRLGLGTEIVIESIQSFDGPFTVRANGTSCSLGRETVRGIFVDPISAESTVNPAMGTQKS
jgi:DtxR family Mn-dependent transcriptional regulator